MSLTSQITSYAQLFRMIYSTVRLLVKLCQISFDYFLRKNFVLFTKAYLLLLALFLSSFGNSFQSLGPSWQMKCCELVLLAVANRVWIMCLRGNL